MMRMVSTRSGTLIPASFSTEHVRQVVHHAAEVVDTVGVRDEAVPRLALGHLLGTTVVVTDVRHAVDDFFAVQLQDDTEGTVRRRVVRAQVEEHVVLVGAGAFHAPVFRPEACSLFFKLLLGEVQAEWVEFGGARREVLAQRVTFPGRRHHDARQVRVAREVDTEHVPDFTLVPAGVGPDAGHGRDAQVAFGEGDLDHHVAVTFDRQQVIEHGEIGAARQALALGPQTLVHAMQVIEHDVRLGQVAQEGQDFDEPGARHPQHRHAGTCGLGGKGVRAKTVIEFDNHILVVCLIRRDVQSTACSHGFLSLSVNVKNEARFSFYKRSGAGSDFVGAAQVGDCDSLFAALFLL